MYCLYSESRDRLYVGQTDNLERRIRQHNSGKVASTKPYRPYRLIYFEEVKNRRNAMMREKELKTTKGRTFLRKILTENAAGGIPPITDIFLRSEKD
ncbi:MAG TPA: GIY-YIG nuclease family protein [Ignavibacteria bacterium]|nr:GIY-YIG nuclease family protein [Ignavibacteria bacterium]